MAKKKAFPAAMRKRLHAALDRILDREPFEEDAGGWPKFEPVELTRLYDFFRKVIDAKYPRDGDRATPVEFTILDRTRFEPMHYMPVAYDHKPDANHADILETRLANLRIAIGAVDTALRLDRHYKRVIEELVKNKQAAKRD
jgi:hypothetical protein